MECSSNLGSNARKQLIGKPIKYYLDIWNEVRAETLRLLKTQNDKWFSSKVPQEKTLKVTPVSR